jgi:hypothetical protein
LPSALALVAARLRILCAPLAGPLYRTWQYAPQTAVLRHAGCWFFLCILLSDDRRSDAGGVEKRGGDVAGRTAHCKRGGVAATTWRVNGGAAVA